MMVNKKNMPEIRFEGFVEEWVESRVGQLCDCIVPGRNKPKVFNGDIPWVTTPDITDNNVGVSKIGFAISKEEAKRVGAKIVPKDSIIMSCVGELGVVAIANNELIINQQLHAFIPNENLNNWFLLYELSTRKKYMENIATKTSVPYMNKNSCNSIPVIIPSPTEQQKIGNYFQNLDKLISQQQEKQKKLRILKKAMLAKMFPANGENVPEIRFKGFSEPWEDKKFKENIVSINTGTNLLGKITNKGIPLIKMGNMRRGFFVFDKIAYLDESVVVEKDNIANYGDFFFNTRNTLELVGKGATWTGLSGKYAFNNNIARFIFTGIDTIFYNYLYNTQHFTSQVQARAMGTTSVAAVYPRSLNSIKYQLPTPTEQQQIGNYFQNLDKLISQQKAQISKLEQLKKACLAQMFV